MITAKVIAHSISDQDIQIITLQLRYPKFIHGELMTHRVFSRNASSSRAIPFERFVEDIERDMAMPVYWGSAKPGMQAGAEIEDIVVARYTWSLAYQAAKEYATQLVNLGLHKQIANRILEPFYCINTLVTSTEWDNFFELRDHPDAQPEIRALAIEMKNAINWSEPTLPRLIPSQWHLPYISYEEKKIYHNNDLIKASVARCARVSYLTHDAKTPDLASDIALHDKLVVSKPMHASPAEHQATPIVLGWQKNDDVLCGNFKGWIQYRKLLESASPCFIREK